MSDNSTIEWTDATWNPVTGCTEVSPGCDHCYARTFAERWRGVPGHYFERGFDVQLRPDKLELPLRWRRPRRIFVNSMSDLFHKDVPDEYIARVFAVMSQAPQHTFQVLTKRHARMRFLLNSDHFRSDAHSRAIDLVQNRTVEHEFRWPLPNVWLGVSVESQQWADIRIPALLDTPAAVRFLSCEPLLGPINLAAWTRWGDGSLRYSEPPQVPGIDWVIAGGESGPGYRFVDIDSVRSLRDQCVETEIPFLFKQVGGRTPKAGGRELDGRTWDEYPVVA